MAANDAAHLARESWSLYGVGIVLIVLRVIARVHRLGWKGLSADDYLMMFGAALYTCLVFCLNRILSGGGSNLYPPELYETFTQEEIEDRIMGSKIVVVSEQAMLMLIYTCKACLLCMYYRLTDGTRQARAVIALSIYVAVGFVATEIGFFTFCRPFKGYWGMPPPNPQCTTLQHYAINQACWNLSSDFCMLLIAIPLVVRLKLPLRQKLILSSVFSLGIFVIIAAILTKVYNLSDLYDTVYMFWYLREASVAVYVANIPMIWPLLREAFPWLKSHVTSGGGSRSMDPSKRRTIGPLSPVPNVMSHKSGTQHSVHELKYMRSIGGSASDEEMQIGEKRGRVVGFAPAKRGGSPASDERVLNQKQSNRFWNEGDIHAEVTIEIERESAEIDGHMGSSIPQSQAHIWSMPDRETKSGNSEKTWS